MPLRQPPPLLVHAQLAMKPRRILKSHARFRSICRRGRRLQQVGALHHFRNHASRRQLQQRKPTDNSAPRLFAKRENPRNPRPPQTAAFPDSDPRTQQPPHPALGIANSFRQAHPPLCLQSQTHPRPSATACRSADTPAWLILRIQILVLPLMRSTHCRRQILPRTPAWIDECRPLAQPLPRRKINLAPLALRIWPERPAHIRPLIPIHLQPAQILECCCCIFCAAPLPVQVLHPHHQRSALIPRPLPRRPERARMPHVQIPRRRRRKPASVPRMRRVKTRPVHHTSSGRRNIRAN